MAPRWRIRQNPALRASVKVVVYTSSAPDVVRIKIRRRGWGTRHELTIHCDELPLVKLWARDVAAERLAFTSELPVPEWIDLKWDCGWYRWSHAGMMAYATSKLGSAA